jgi:hypothetical protein
MTSPTLLPTRRQVIVAVSVILRGLELIFVEGKADYLLRVYDMQCFL